MHNNRVSKLQAYIQPEYFFWSALLCAGFLFFSEDRLDLPTSSNAEASAVTALRDDIANPFNLIELLAKGAYVYDVAQKKELFSKNADEVLPLASITKVMTAITALSIAPETTDIKIDAGSLQAEGDSGFEVGERWKLRDLLAFTLLESSNDGAVAVSSAIGEALSTSTRSSVAYRAEFVLAMNAFARTIGLSSSVFLNESGLDMDETRAGAFSSPRDTAMMLAYALETFPTVFAKTRFDSLSLTNEKERRPAKNTNTETNNLPLLLASKTGYTDLAGGNLVIAFDAGFGHTIVISVLGSTIDGRFTDVENLAWATLRYLAQST